MKIELASAMRRATQQLRSQNLAEATRLIQDALRGGADAPAAGAAAETKEAQPGRSEPSRRSLAETLNVLKDNAAFDGLPGMGASGLHGRRAPPKPDGARFESRSFTCAAGTRPFRLYVPASAPDRPRGLIVMLHGCTQNPDDFALGTGMNAVAEAHGFAVVYPGQTRADNANVCWNWFEPNHQRRGIGEPAILAGMTEAIIAEFNIDPARTFVAGLSAGGAMAAVMGEAYPELYAAVGVHSGLPTHAAKDMSSAFAVMRGDRRHAGRRDDAARAIRTIVFHGDADKTVHPSNADHLIDAATPPAATISSLKVAGLNGGRSADLTVVANPAGETVAERWVVNGAGHAWSGGHAGGSYVDAAGPDASKEMMRFFLGEPLRT